MLQELLIELRGTESLYLLKKYPIDEILRIIANQVLSRLRFAMILLVKEMSFYLKFCVIHGLLGSRNMEYALWAGVGDLLVL